MSVEPKNSLSAREAELLARQFNSAFMTTSSYGTSHPMAEKVCATLAQTVAESLLKLPALTLLLDRGAIFVEKHAVGQRFNPRRLINLLSRMNIESITFSRGIRQPELVALMEVLGDPESNPDVDAARQQLARNGISHVQLNYVVFRKVTADQKVVASSNDDEEADEMTFPTLGDQAEDTFGSIASLMSLSELVRDPQQFAGRVAEQNHDEYRNRQVVRQLRNLVSQIESGELAAENAMSSELVLGAVNSLRRKVRKSFETRQDVELILAEEDQVLGEIDQLTYSTLVALVREEFRCGKFSASRMAQIINRMLPDARDLKRLLPQLKHGLLAEGMSLTEYSRLVHELSTELRGEHLVKALEQGAESIGLDVDEIVDQIRDDPAEAARLIVMATELRRGGASDEEQLSAAFSDYIERVSEKLITPEPGNTDGGSEAMGQQLSRVQQLLVDQLNRQGLPPELIDELQQHLAERMERRSKSEPETKPKPKPEEPQPASTSTAPTAPPAKLPSRVFNPVNTAYFLKREIKLALRYRRSFSLVKVSIELVRELNGTVRVPAPEELNVLIGDVYDEIINQMRDLDLVGSLDRKYRAVPLLILPMTDQEGVDVFAKRLEKGLSTRPYRFGSDLLQLQFALTALSHKFEENEEPSAFLKRLDREHERNRKRSKQSGTNREGREEREETAGNH
jgi:hypothetical protein